MNKIFLFSNTNLFGYLCFVNNNVKFGCHYKISNFNKILTMVEREVFQGAVKDDLSSRKRNSTSIYIKPGQLETNFVHFSALATSRPIVITIIFSERLVIKNLNLLYTFAKLRKFKNVKHNFTL